MRFGPLAVAVVFALCSPAQQTEDAGGPKAASSSDETREPVVPSRNIAPVSSSSVAVAPAPDINWKGIRNASGLFLSVQHLFRLTTEPGTREGMKGPFFPGWAQSVGALHGWSDGDPFLVNYIGHPMQGAVAGYIFLQNDYNYREAEFGANRHYWMGRLRATLFSFGYSAQFEIGPISEASIGNIQARYPQQGLVDLVATPILGLGWMIAEDAIDRYIIKRFERRYESPKARALVRGLNPGRSFANLMNMRFPGYRDSRPGVHYDHKALVAAPRKPAERTWDDSPVAPFEFISKFQTAYFLGANGGGPCAGAGGTAAFRLSPNWQALFDVDSCSLVAPKDGLSGDQITYMAGSRWVGGNARWRPHFQVLLGGQKTTHENPDKPNVSGEIVNVDDVTGFVLGTGFGLSYRVNRALAVDVANFEYRRSWSGPLNGYDYRNQARFSTGVTLRVGTW